MGCNRPILNSTQVFSSSFLRPGRVPMAKMRSPMEIGIEYRFEESFTSRGYSEVPAPKYFRKSNLDVNLCWPFYLAVDTRPRRATSRESLHPCSPCTFYTSQWLHVSRLQCANTPRRLIHFTRNFLPGGVSPPARLLRFSFRYTTGHSCPPPRMQF